ncbi:hypothetical protein SD70_24770 [Gordoniibacillus kamchatkensis]|uniref:Transposase n=1 Tax=Gordoniibacillus kamchatkensis TaxID=1590651 RepID=A0ABR5ACB7_9BACL|nr:hypothetical protein [Paenibacillus sp. VKM B-2647]KIL38668.1 hypothetical protein SD70_24770 [Paenibacillus sp. VKM B-2647]
MNSRRIELEINALKQSVADIQLRLDILERKQSMADQPHKPRRGIKRKQASNNPSKRFETKVNIDSGFADLREMNKRALDLLRYQ